MPPKPPLKSLGTVACAFIRELLDNDQVFILRKQGNTDDNEVTVIFDDPKGHYCTCVRYDANSPWKVVARGHGRK
jgi:hypothetical protein